MSDEPSRPEVGRLRPRYVQRVGVEHVRSRVSVRHTVDDPVRGPVPTDVVGRLLAVDDDIMLVVDRDGRLHTIDAHRILASRVVPTHPRLPAEPDVGTEDAPLERRAARVLLLDPDDRVLLIAHAPDPVRRVWTAPGGGSEPNEDLADAARREVEEELGFVPTLGPAVWRRRVRFTFRSVWLEQDETWFLARTSEPSAAAHVVDAPLDDAGAVEARWWTLEQLEATDQELAPRSLPQHLRALLRDGPPPTPVDVGR